MANSIWQATVQNATGDIIPGAEMTVVDENTGLPATIFSSIGGAALTNPFFADSEGFAQFYAASGTYRVTANDSGTGQTITWRYIRFGDAASRDVGTASGNVMEVGAGGLLDNAIRWATTDLNDIDKTGFYDIDGSDINNPSGGGHLIHSENAPEDNAAQIYVDVTGTGRIYFNNKVVGVWQGFKELYHSGNLNPNVFGGLAAGIIRTDCYARNAASLRFELNHEVIGTPSSITVSGTFTVLDTSFNVIRSAIPAGDFSVVSFASKNIYINIANMSGLILDKPYVLRSDTAGSTITVNF